MVAANISKETKVMTVLDIEGCSRKNIVDFMGHLTTPTENSVYLCNKYMGLPNYSEMGKLYDTLQPPPIRSIDL